MFRLKNDNSLPVITAQKHIKSCRKTADELHLPKTAILFFMHGGVEYLSENYNCELITEKFPRFLNSCPIYKAVDYEFCFLHGGHGAPQAVDTLETLNALGVEQIVTVGMFGTFGENVECSDIIIPSKAFVEEGTSLHYYEDILFSSPDEALHKKALELLKGKDCPIVSTDAVYRQTFLKENEWRTMGAVGVDMETSALFSVGKYLGLKVVSVLVASDKHPQSPNESDCKWHMPKSARMDFFEKTISFATNII